MTRRAAIRFTLAAAVAATGFAALAARGAVALIENRALSAVQGALTESDEWLEVSVSGTVLRLHGAAPDSAAQIDALTRIGKNRAGLKVVDETVVAAASAEPSSPAAASPAPDQAPAVPPRVEILRDGLTVTAFGAAPAPDIDAHRFATVPGLEAGAEVSHMLEPAGDTAPEHWDAAVALAMKAVPLLDRARVVVEPGSVLVSGTAGSEELRALTVRTLEDARPGEVALRLDITAPRPVIAPFVFRASLDGETTRVQACTAETEASRARIAAAAGIDEAALDCAIGLGAPSPEWATTVAAGLEVLERLGGGSISISDADIALVGPRGHDAVDFSQQVSWLSEQLPEVFSLSSSLPERPDEGAEETVAPPPLFAAVRTEDGAVRIRGDMTGAQLQQTAVTFAEAQFGFDTVVDETELREDLPPGWPARVMAGLEALGLMTSGQLEVTESIITLNGNAPDPLVETAMRSILEARLPAETTFHISLQVVEPEPAVNTLTIPASLCGEQIAMVLDGNQIVFPPNETEISEDSLPVIESIAEILGTCPAARFEIGGHTDSQGRESTNMALSQARADAVLSALLERGVDTVFLYSRGYGESSPIAPNDTEEGRALNRRIEFRLLTGDEASETAAEALENAPEADAGPGAVDADPPTLAGGNGDDGPSEAVAIDGEAPGDEEGAAATVTSRSVERPTLTVTTRDSRDEAGRDTPEQEDPADPPATKAEDGGGPRPVLRVDAGVSGEE